MESEVKFNKMSNLCKCGCGKEVKSKNRYYTLGHNPKSNHSKGFQKGGIGWNKLPTKTLICKYCKNEKIVSINYKGILCSRKCFSLYSKGKVISEEQKDEISKTLKYKYEKGIIKCWCIGLNKNNCESLMISSIKNKNKKNLFYNSKEGLICKKKISEARIKQIIPNKDTSIEIKLQNELKNRGINFITHKPILGQPDVFIQPNICVFADGNYWHKFPNGTQKDVFITKKLQENKYMVLRYWEHEINENINAIVDEIEDYLVLMDNKEVYNA